MFADCHQPSVSRGPSESNYPSHAEGPDALKALSPLSEASINRFSAVTPNDARKAVTLCCHVYGRGAPIFFGREERITNVEALDRDLAQEGASETVRRFITAPYQYPENAAAGYQARCQALQLPPTVSEARLFAELRLRGSAERFIQELHKTLDRDPHAESGPQQLSSALPEDLALVPSDRAGRAWPAGLFPKAVEAYRRFAEDGTFFALASPAVKSIIAACEERGVQPYSRAVYVSSAGSAFELTSYQIGVMRSAESPVPGMCLQPLYLKARREIYCH